MLLTLTAAAKLPGAPSQPALHRMTGNKRVPGFLVKTEKGWRVDDENGEWAACLARTPGRALPQKVAGNRVKAARGKNPPGNAPGLSDGGGRRDERCRADGGGGGDGGGEITGVQKALEAKIIYNARREKLKMEQDEIKTGAMKEEYVVKAEGQYWLSFIRRGITGGFSVTRRLMPEIKRLILAGEDVQAMKILNAGLKAAWEQTEAALDDALDGKEDGDDGN